MQNPSKVLLWGLGFRRPSIGNGIVRSERLGNVVDAGIEMAKRRREGRSEEEARAKVEQCEKFVDKRLKPDLVAVIGVLNSVSAAVNLC